MKNSKKQTETMRLAYESPCVDLTCLEEDILTVSTDVGKEYPDTWN